MTPRYRQVIDYITEDRHVWRFRFFLDRSGILDLNSHVHDLIFDPDSGFTPENGYRLGLIVNEIIKQKDIRV